MPKPDSAAFTLGGVSYRFLGWLGAQLESRELPAPRAGSLREIAGKTFRAIYVGPADRFGLGKRRVLWVLMPPEDDSSLDASCRVLY